MKILCSISGINFTCPQFSSLVLSNKKGDFTTAHPVFFLAPSKLTYPITQYMSDTRALNAEEIYLLSLALMHASGLLEYEHHVQIPQDEDEIYLWASKHLHNLYRLCGRILESKNHPQLSLPTIKITFHTSSFLGLVNSFMQTMSEELRNFTDFNNTIQRNREAARLSNSKARVSGSPKKFASQLSLWAADAASFPTFQTTLFTGRKLSLRDYWIEILKSCTNADKIFLIPQVDIDELKDHIEIELPPESLYKKEILELIAGGNKLKAEYLGFSAFDSLGEDDIKGQKIPHSFEILDTSPNSPIESIKQASIEATSLISLTYQDGKLEEPQESNFSSRLAYLRAKARFEQAAKINLSKESKNESI